MRFDFFVIHLKIIMELPFTKEDIIAATGINSLKVKDILIFGSRVYGSANEKSDYDIVVIAGALLPHEEKKVTVNGVHLNIHIYTQDVFIEALKKHDIMNLESIMAPDWARLLEKTVYSKEINKKKLIKNNLTQSQNSWFLGKTKIKDGNITKGVKGIFHAMRMLMFATQIIEHGFIVDFSAGNKLYDEMINCDEFEWDYYKEKYLPIKIELEEKLKSLILNEEIKN